MFDLVMYLVWFGIIALALAVPIALIIVHVGTRDEYPKPPTDLDDAWADIEEMRLNN